MSHPRPVQKKSGTVPIKAGSGGGYWQGTVQAPALHDPLAKDKGSMEGTRARQVHQVLFGGMPVSQAVPAFTIG
jgi:hypothetical protein